MILRRVIEHVKKQEWTAIFIDFVIVVLGVFVGIQVSNWNAARAERAYERVFIEMVRDAITGEAEDLRGYADLFENDLKFGARALATLDAPVDCTGNCWPQIVDFFLASQWIDVSGERTTFNEMQRTGLPRDRPLKSIIFSYYGLWGQMAAISALPAYRERVRSIIPATIQDYFWRNCFRTEGRRQYFNADCPAPADAAATGAVVAALRADPELKGALNFWLSTASVMTKTLNDLTIEAERTIATIDTYLREHP